MTPTPVHINIARSAPPSRRTDASLAEATHTFTLVDPPPIDGPENPSHVHLVTVRLASGAVRTMVAFTSAIAPHTEDDHARVCDQFCDALGAAPFPIFNVSSAISCLPYGRHMNSAQMVRFWQRMGSPLGVGSWLFSRLRPRRTDGYLYDTPASRTVAVII